MVNILPAQSPKPGEEAEILVLHWFGTARTLRFNSQEQTKSYLQRKRENNW